MRTPPEDFYGHPAEPIVAYHCGKCGRELHEQQDGTYTHEPRGGYGPYDDMGRWGKIEDKQAREAKAADAIPYTGASVKRCQRAVWERGRAPNSWRCVRTNNLFVIPNHGDPMVVCKQHVTSPGFRWKNTGHFLERRGDPTASEPIEPEFLAQLPQRVEKGGQSAH